MKTTRMVAVLAVLLVAFGGQWNLTPAALGQQESLEIPDTSSPPASYRPTPSSLASSPSAVMAADILLIQTAWPWESTADVDVLNSLGYSYEIVDMSTIDSVDIFSYPVVLIVNDQVQAFYDSYAQQIAEFEAYISNGGTLVFFAASDGWALGTLTAPLPGGVTVNTPDYEAYNYIVDPAHPIVTGMLSDGISLEDADLYGNWTSHGTFSNLLPGTTTILRDDDMMPTMIEYQLGGGRVVASTNTWEFHYIRDAWGSWAQKALDDVFLYAFTGGVLPDDDVIMDLHIEDAPEGVVVNKLAGEATGAAGLTSLDVVAKAASFNWDVHDGITFTLQVEGDTLSTPQHTYFRWLDGSTPTEIPFQSIGDGKYQVTVDLPGIWFLHFGQVIWRFAIPADVAAQQVDLEATIAAPDYPLADPSSKGTLNLVTSPDNIVVTNRRLLYDRYGDAEVSELLGMLYTTAQGSPRNENPVSVIYYVDRYDSEARNWDQDPTYPGTEASVNVAANAVDELIEDWYDDATTYLPLEILPGITLRLPLITPDYLTILGDDDVIPFYRYNDPTDDEGGWGVTNANNPAIEATDHDYFFTDNVYADISGGTDWQTGDLELAVGRIVGDTAAEMNQFLRHGVDETDQDTGRVVMASVDGWELGLVPHQGAGVADLHNVPALFTAHGFETLNDTENPVTIDILRPSQWNDTDLQTAANDGMDLFFIGGHNSYNRAFINDTEVLFHPNNTPTDYSRIDEDGPLAMIVGCHGGMSVSESGNIGGADDNMVRDLVRAGASGYIGATGFSYGSPRDLHNCTWGENLIQRYFSRFLQTTTSASQTIGKAMQQAKDEYEFGVGESDDHDRKTVTEFTVYGVPWQRINYPTATAQEMLPTAGATLSATTAAIRIDATNTFTQIVEIQVPDYEHTTEGTFDLLSIPGGSTDYSDGYPVIPYFKAFDMPLPFNATIESLEIVKTNSHQVGPYNLPIAQVGPYSEGGISFTNLTDLDEYYPADLVTLQTDQSEAHVFVSPIQHNPTTNETRFYDHFTVEIGYSAPLTLAISDFQTDKDAYSPDDPVTIGLRIHNIGDQEANATLVTSFVDPHGVAVRRVEQSGMTIPAGGHTDFEDTLDPLLPAGAYTVLCEVKLGDFTVAWAESKISVMDAGITSFSHPSVLVIGEYGIFALALANHSTASLSVEGEVVLYDQATGLEAGRLLRQRLTIDPAQEESATWSWDSAAVPVGNYTAIATAYSGTNTYGPVQGTFRVVSDMPPNLTSSSMSVDKEEAKAGDTLTYVIELQNTSAVTATSVLLEDTIPFGISYVIDSAEASSGTLFDGEDIRWLGTLTPGASATITFQVSVDEADGLTIHNQALVTDPAIAELIVLQADTIIPPIFRIYLPSVIR